VPWYFEVFAQFCPHGTSRLLENYSTNSLIIKLHLLSTCFRVLLASKFESPVIETTQESYLRCPWWTKLSPKIPLHCPQSNWYVIYFARSTCLVEGQHASSGPRVLTLIEPEESQEARDLCENVWEKNFWQVCLALIARFFLAIYRYNDYRRAITQSIESFPWAKEIRTFEEMVKYGLQVRSSFSFSKATSYIARTLLMPAKKFFKHIDYLE